MGLKNVVLMFAMISLSATASAADLEQATPGSSLHNDFDQIVETAKMNSMHPDIQDLLLFHRRIGTANEADVASISKFLAAKGVRLADKLVRPVFSSSAIRWGSTEIFKRADGSIKTKGGAIVALVPSGSFSETFIAMFNTVSRSTPPSSSLNRLWQITVPSSEAQERTNKALEDASAALSPGVYIAVNSFFIAVGCPMAGLMAPIGGYVQLLRAVIQPLREWMQAGSIECDGTDYVFKNVELNTLDLAKMVKRGYEFGSLPKTELSRVMGICVGASAYGAESILSLFLPGTFPSLGVRIMSGLDRTVKSVPPADLEKAFSKQPPPNCSPQSAKVVKAYFETKVQAVEKKVVAKFGSLASSPNRHSGTPADAKETAR